MADNLPAIRPTQPVQSQEIENRATSHLQQHKGRKFDNSYDALERRPIEFLPSREAAVNLERLPSPDTLLGTQLAYREEPLSEGEMLSLSDGVLGWLMIWPVAVAMLMLLVLPILPWSMGFGIVGIITFYVLVRHGIRRGIALPQQLACLLLPSAIFIAGKLFSQLLAHRFIAGAALSAVALFAVAEYGKRPFRFFSQWLLTHPRLKPTSRQDQELTVDGPSMPLLLLVLGIALMVPEVSMFFAMLATLLTILFWLWFGVSRYGPDPLKAIQRYTAELRKVLAHYLCYDLFSSGAPGVWRFRVSVAERQRKLALVVCPIAFALTASLSGFFPWDAPGVKEQFLSVCTDVIAGDEGALEAFQFMTPNLPWKKFPGTGAPLSEVLPEEIARDYAELQPDQRVVQALRDLQNDVENLSASQKLLKDRLQQRKSYDDRVRKFFEDGLSSTTNTWAAVTLFGVFSGQFNFLWCYVVAIFMALFITSGMLLVLFLPPMRSLARETNRIANLDQDGRTEWQWHVDRLRGSDHICMDPLGDEVRERDHLFLGIHPVDDFPVLLDKSLLAEHCYLVGDSGSGKTSLGLMPLLTQLIRGNTSGTSASDDSRKDIERKLRDPDELPPPMLILDLKGDMAFFNTIRAEVEARQGKEAFLYFTPEQGMASCYFNPFSSFQSDSRSLVQLCHLFLDSLSLNHGEGYGRSYYSRRARYALLKALESDPAPRSFKELYEAVKPPKGKDQAAALRDTFELISAIHALTYYPQLNVTGDQPYPERCIHMPTLLEKRQVAYFWLPAALESVSVKEIAKLAIYSLLTAAIDRQREGKEVRQMYLVIDEFQRVAAENFKIILEQARSFGIAAILANQTRSDLKMHDIDLRPTVNTNTRVKQFFSVTDPLEMRELAILSGEELAQLTSESITIGGEAASATSSWADSIKSRLTVNDILRISDHPLESILHVSRGSGFTQFGGGCVRVRGTWSMHKSINELRKKQPWPAPSDPPSTPDEPADEPPVVKNPEKPTKIDDRVRQTLEDAMADLFERQAKQYEYDDPQRPKAPQGGF